MLLSGVVLEDLDQVEGFVVGTFVQPDGSLLPLQFPLHDVVSCHKLELFYGLSLQDLVKIILPLVDHRLGEPLELGLDFLDLLDGSEFLGTHRPYLLDDFTFLLLELRNLRVNLLELVRLRQLLAEAVQVLNLTLLPLDVLVVLLLLPYQKPHVFLFEPIVGD